MLEEDGKAEQAFPGSVVVHDGSFAGDADARIQTFLGALHRNDAKIDDLPSAKEREDGPWHEDRKT